jgi:hypothetical protein
MFLENTAVSKTKTSWESGVRKTTASINTHQKLVSLIIKKDNNKCICFSPHGSRCDKKWQGCGAGWSRGATHRTPRAGQSAVGALWWATKCTGFWVSPLTPTECPLGHRFPICICKGKLKLHNYMCLHGKHGLKRCTSHFWTYYSENAHWTLSTALANSMEESPSWKADSGSASQ